MAQEAHPLVSAGELAQSPELAFEVTGAAPAEGAVPAITLALRVQRTAGPPVRALTLTAQVRIAAPRRPYDDQTRERLYTLFGPVADWGRSLRGLQWTRATIAVPGFEDEVTVDLELPCSYDVEVAHNGYMDAVRDGVIPLELLFSGTLFYAGEDNRLRVAQLSWEYEAAYALPAGMWRAALDRHLPGARWVRLDAERYDRLREFRSRGALPSWEATVDALLDGD